jgi:hypothetical protein
LADDMVLAEASVTYFNSAAKSLGQDRVNDFHRLFMIPDMEHCGVGRGANVLFE